MPLFYRRDRKGLPKRWLARARHSLVSVPARFSTHRMVGDYVEQGYLRRS